VNELLEFQDGTLGLAMNLDEETIGAVVLGSVDNIEEEQIVRATGRILSMPLATRCSSRGERTGFADRRQGTARESLDSSHGSPGARHHWSPAVSEPLQTASRPSTR